MAEAVRIGDLKPGDEVHYQNAVYRVVANTDDVTHLAFVRNEYRGYPPVYDMDALIKEG